jgi:hypothetical protein
MRVLHRRTGKASGKRPMRPAIPLGCLSGMLGTAWRRATLTADGAAEDGAPVSTAAMADGKAMGLPGGRGSPIERRDRDAGQAACRIRALRPARLAASTASTPASAKPTTNPPRDARSQPGCPLGSGGAGPGARRPPRSSSTGVPTRSGIRSGPDRPPCWRLTVATAAGCRVLDSRWDVRPFRGRWSLWRLGVPWRVLQCPDVQAVCWFRFMIAMGSWPFRGCRDA